MTRKEVNASLKRTNIKGKDYVEVDQRILAFWEIYPNGCIETELVDFDKDSCLFVARCYDNGVLLSMGHAMEEKNASYINKTSFIENCETSAVGRALGILGIGVIGSIASADEVSNAITAQEEAKANKNTKATKTASQNAPQTPKQAFNEYVRRNNSKKRDIHLWCIEQFGADYTLTDDVAAAALSHFTEN